MSRTKMNRRIALLLSAMLFLTIPFAFTAEANAASGSKTIYVVSEMHQEYQSVGGAVEKETTKYTYDKKGLLKKVSSSGGIMEAYKNVITRNNAGAIKNTKRYNSKGKLIYTNKNTIKNGKIKKMKSYNVNPTTGKKTLYSTTTYTYKKGKLSKAVTKGKDYTINETYYANGNLKKSVYKSDDTDYTYCYDKKGYSTKYTSKNKYGDTVSTSTTTFNRTFDKKGNIKKEIATTKNNYGGTVTTSTETTSYNISYKNGRVAKRITKNTYKSGEYSFTSTSTVTYKYKKVKVAKKYLKYANQ